MCLMFLKVIKINFALKYLIDSKLLFENVFDLRPKVKNVSSFF